MGDGREVTEQDRVLYALCRPDRLLDLARRFTLFDLGIKKVARYQQFFAVKNILAKVKAARFRGPPAGRRHLAYPGFRQVPHHGHAGPGSGARPGNRESRASCW